MPSLPPRWTLRAVPDLDAVAHLSQSLNDLPEALARTLVLRGVRSFDEAKRYFRDSISALHDPFLMRDMDRAVERVIQAIQANERALVYGDYDVDGTTSTALMVLFLRQMGMEADFFIPNRFEHGYGLCEAGLDEAKRRGASLVVALDCGVTAVDEAAYAKSIGLDLVICDHHKPKETLPDVVALLDPKRPDCSYPFDGLSGCGVGFKLVQGVLQKLGRPLDEAFPLLDLVAVSTASDIVPLVDENRVLMRVGMRQLRERPRVGLQALAALSRVKLEHATTSDIVFRIGPRINAAGRIADASLATDLLIEEDPSEAQRLANEIEALNLHRRELDQQTRDEAFALAEPFMAGDPAALVLCHRGWHPGVIGITASRVAEHFHRPCVLLSVNKKGMATGSARSIAGLSIYDALQQCSHLLTRFGGHAFAAGVSLPADKVDTLRENLQASVGEALTPELREPELDLDAELNLNAIDDRFWRVLQQFGPFGPDNAKPTFWGRGLKVVGQPTTVGHGRHLKLRVAQHTGGAPFSVIGFGLADRLDAALMSARRGRPLELAFNVEENRYNGRTSLQLRAVDVRMSDGA